MPNLILAQTQSVAGCGAIVGCSGATIAATPQAREATKDGTPGGSELTIAIGLGATQAGVMFQSADNEPGKNTWDAGDWVVRLNVTTGSDRINWVATYVCRFNNACGSLAVVGSLTGQSISCELTGVKQMTVAGAEQSANLSDEIYIVLIFQNTFAHGEKGIGFTPDQNIDSPIVVTQDYSLLCEAGSFEELGQSLNLLKDSKISISEGSYEEVGQAVNLLKESKLDIGIGEYALVGQEASLKRGYGIIIGVGDYALAGQVVGVYYNRRVSAGVGSFDWVGFDADLIYTTGGYELSAEAGSFALNGQIATLLKESKIIIGPDSFALSGQDVGLLIDRILQISSGEYSLSGYLANLLKESKLIIESGDFEWIGFKAELIAAEIIIYLESALRREISLNSKLNKSKELESKLLKQIDAFSELRKAINLKSKLYGDS